MPRPQPNSSVCPSCGRLVEVRAARCPHCRRALPALLGASRWLDALFTGSRSFVRIFLIATLAVSVLDLILHGLAREQAGLDADQVRSPLQLAGSLSWTMVVQGGQWWRLLSWLFLHQIPMHLLLNLWSLWVLGPPVEVIYGKARFVVIYLGTGLFAGVVSLFGHASLPVDSVGASGALFGLMGILVVHARRRGDEIGRVNYRRLTTLAVVFLCLGLMPGMPLDNWAHGGGFVAGLGLGAVLRPRDQTLRGEGPGVRLLAVAGMVVTLVCVGTMVWQAGAPAHGQQTESLSRSLVRADQEARSLQVGAPRMDRQAKAQRYRQIMASPWLKELRRGARELAQEDPWLPTVVADWDAVLDSLLQGDGPAELLPRLKTLQEHIAGSRPSWLQDEGGSSPR